MSKPQARDFAGRLREEAEALVEGFRQKSRYFQWKAYIAAAYAALVALTLVIVSWDSNDLAAEWAAGQSPLGATVSVTNNSDEMWTEVKFVLNGQYEYTQKTVLPGGRVPALVSQFVQVDKDGKRKAAPKDLVPRTLAIHCEEGSVELEVGKH